MKNWFIAIVLCLSTVSFAFGADFSSMLVYKATTSEEQKIEKKVQAASDSATEKTAAKIEEYADDASLTADVKLALSEVETLKDAKIEVTTVKGVVTLSGKVNNEKEKREAIIVAKLVKNVKAVKSKLVVERSFQKSKKKVADK